MHKLHKRLVKINMFSFHEEDGLAMIKLKVPYKMMFIVFFIEFTGRLIAVFPQEEDGVTIWGPARGRSPLPHQVGDKITPVIFLSSCKKSLHLLSLL